MNTKDIQNNVNGQPCNRLYMSPSLDGEIFNSTIAKVRIILNIFRKKLFRSKNFWNFVYKIVSSAQYFVLNQSENQTIFL